MKIKKVLLYVDQKRRDLYPMQRLYDSLLLCKNVNVLISGKLDFLFTVHYFKPDIIVFGKADGFHGDWLRCISGAVVFSIHTEQGYDSKEDTVLNFMDGHSYCRPPAHDCVDYYLLGSDITKKHLKGHLPDEKMVVVGYPRLLSKSYATSARKVSSNFKIGVACGENVGDDVRIQNYFEHYFDKSFGYLTDVRGFLSFMLLDRCFTRHIVNLLKKKYNLIVRYRFGDSHYLLDEEGVKVDKSSSPLSFIEEADLIIINQTTLGIEAMMCGVPVISIINLLNINNLFESVCNFSYIKTCWQPKSLEELVNLVEMRKKDELPLCPDYASYNSLVSRTYYMDGNSDNSIENIIRCIENCKLKDGSILDVKILKNLLKLSLSESIVLNFQMSWLFNPLYFMYLTYRFILSNLFSKYDEVYVPSPINFLYKPSRIK